MNLLTRASLLALGKSIYYIITFVIIEAVMAAQAVFSLPVWWEGWGVRRYFSHNRGGFGTNFFVLERGGGGGTV